MAYLYLGFLPQLRRKQAFEIRIENLLPKNGFFELYHKSKCWELSRKVLKYFLEFTMFMLKSFKNVSYSEVEPG